MNKAILWSSFYTKRILFLLLILIAAGLIFFRYNFISFGYIAFAVVSIVIFFKGLENIPKYLISGNIPLKLFWFTILIRIGIVFILYLYYYTSVHSPYGEFFAPNAEDATGYHYIARWMAADFWSGEINYEYYTALMGSHSDMGYIYWTLPWYIVFGPHLWLQGIFNLIVGAWSVVLVYKIALYQFTKKIAILSAVMTMLYSSFILYTSSSLKEMVLIWVMLVAIYHFQLYLKLHKQKALNLFIAMLFIFFLAFFRNFLVILLSFAFFMGLYFNSKRGSNLQLIIFILFGAGSLIALGNIFGFSNEIQSTVDSAPDMFEGVVSRRAGNALAVKFASLPVFLLYTIPGPLVSFVKTGDQQTIWLQFSGFFIRNVLMFFYAYGLYSLIRNSFRPNIFLIIITLGYLFIMAYTGYVTNGRYHLVAAPLLFFFSAYGYSIMTSKKIKWFDIFLIFIFILNMGWNYFKLLGRGLM